MLNENKKAGGIRAAAMVAAMTALCLGLFFTSESIAPSSGTKIFLLIFSLVCAALCLCAMKDRSGEMNKYRTKGSMLCVGLIALYASFASFGQRYFMEGNSRFHFSAPGLLYLVLGALWFVPVIGAMLLPLEKMAGKGRAQGEKCSWPFYLVCLGLYTAWTVIVFLAFRPGGFPPDSISQLFQAIGFDYIYDWHPALHTLCMRLILRLTGNRAMMIPAAQMLVFAMLTASWVCFIIERGCPRWAGISGGLIFLMLPNNVLSSVSAVKDFPYTLALMWCTLLLVRLMCDMEEECRIWKLIRLGLSIFLVYGFRHNGMVPAALCMLALVLIAVKYRARLKLRPLIAVAAAVAMILVYKGPIFALFNVKPNTASPYTTMLCAVASCINKDLPLSEETEEIMESVISLEEWAEYYDRYQGHDRYIWDRGEDAEFITEHIDAKMAFTAYFDALLRYPDVVIKDRLDGMDLMWDIRQPYDSLNFRTFDRIYLMPGSEFFFDVEGFEEIGYYEYARPSALASFYRAFTEKDTNTAADMLLWRTGAYLVLGLALLLFMVKNRMGRLLWAMVPLAGNIISLMLLLYHQSFRYVYALQPLIIGLALAAVFTRESFRAENK